MFDKKLIRSGTNSIKWNQYHDPGLIAMSTADMDFLSPPCVTEALVRRASTGMFAYEFKSDAYFDAIIQWNRQKYGWKVEKQWLSNAPGIWSGIRICIDSFTNPGDKILVHSPTFHPIIEIAQKSGRKLIDNPLILKDGKYHIDFDDFEKKAACGVKLLLLVNPHNPTGRVFTREELLRMEEICRKYNILVLSDEVHGGVIFSGHQHIPYAAVSEETSMSSIVITSVSKAFNLQSLTYAILIIPNKELWNTFESALKGYNLDFATNAFSLAAVEAAYKHGEPWLDELTAYLEGNLNDLLGYFETKIPRIKTIRPEGGYLVWLDCRGLGMNKDEIEDFFMTKAKVALTFGPGFGKEGEGFVRINIGCSRILLREALERIEEAVNGLS